VRLPVVKVLWGMFAFPAMFPAATFRAASWPLLGIIALSLVWASGGWSSDLVTGWVFLIPNAVLFAWLAVRIHRAVLLDGTAETGNAHDFALVYRYFAALTAGAALKVLFFFLALTLISLGSIAFAWFMPATTTPPTQPPGPDPDIQRLINFVGIVGQAPVLYLLARWSTLLPALALDLAWAPRSAWRQTEGNGWRLVLVVFLLPWTLSAAIGWANASTANNVLVALLAIARAVFLALGVIALSLSYRELSPWPEPPPTSPPV
jgi:hypothetical protein